MPQEDGIEIDQPLLDGLIASLRRDPDKAIGISEDDDKEPWTHGEASEVGELYRKALTRKGLEVRVEVFSREAPNAGFGAGFYPPSRAERQRQRQRQQAEDARATEQAVRDLSRELDDAEKARDEYRAVRDAAIVTLEAFEDAMRKALAALPPDHPAYRLLDEALNPSEDSG